MYERPLQTPLALNDLVETALPEDERSSHPKRNEFQYRVCKAPRQDE